VETSNVNKVLDGGLDEFIAGYLKRRAASVPVVGGSVKSSMKE
jgi:hypothetical protein